MSLIAGKLGIVLLHMARGRALSVIVSVLAACSLAQALTPAERERLSRGDIVATRPTASPGILGGRAQVLVEAAVDEVWPVLNDCSRFSEFIPRYLVSIMADQGVVAAIRGYESASRDRVETVVRQHRIDSWPGDTVYFYNILDVPFPFPDRWYLLEMVRDTARHRIQWDQVAGNTVVNYGSWKLDPFEDGSRTLVTYTTFSDPGIHLPGFILNLGFKQTLPGSVGSLRDRVYQICRLGRYAPGNMPE